MKICIQAGHQNTTTSATGAPGEMDFNIDVANQVSAGLRAKGFDVKQTDANADKDPQVTEVDWNLFLAIHYDADIYNASGGFVDYADPTIDQVTAESQRIRGIISDEYFAKTGIENHPERSNLNTRRYYMWSHLTGPTPCNLIECGIGWRVPKDHELFTYQRNLVVEGIVRGICKAFNVPYDPITPPPVEPPIEPPVEPPPNCSECEEKLAQCETNCAVLEGKNKVLQARLSAISAIANGKGFVWQKLARIKTALLNG